MVKGRKKGPKNKDPGSGIYGESPEIVNAPHSFVLHRGLPCLYIKDLTRDIRHMMEPFTASSLKERRNNRIKDFVSLSGIFHVSHMCILNKSTNQLSLKTARLPRGPTLTFKIHQFTLARDVIADSRKQFVEEEAFRHAPLAVLNNFSGEGKHLKLMATTFQNMFPTINLATVQLSTIKRCVLFSYNPVTKLVDMRHYIITVSPVGLNKGVKKVVMGQVPNLSKCEDISEYFTHAGLHSDSEFEDDETGHVVLPQPLKSRGNIENNKSAIKLYEIGPRLTIELIKIEEGLLNGEVLYHDTIVKTTDELQAIKKNRLEKKKLKEQRKRIQEENVMKKEQVKQDHKYKSLGGMKANEDNQQEYEPDDDAEYYKEAVGEAPDEDLFTKHVYSRKRPQVHMHQKQHTKKIKLNNKGDEDDGKKFDKKKPRDGKKSFGEISKSKKLKSKKDKKVKHVKKGKKKVHRNKNK